MLWSPAFYSQDTCLWEQHSLLLVVISVLWLGCRKIIQLLECFSLGLRLGWWVSALPVVLCH